MDTRIILGNRIPFSHKINPLPWRTLGFLRPKRVFSDNMPVSRVARFLLHQEILSVCRQLSHRWDPTPPSHLASILRPIRVPILQCLAGNCLLLASHRLRPISHKHQVCLSLKAGNCLLPASHQLRPISHKHRVCLSLEVASFHLCTHPFPVSLWVHQLSRQMVTIQSYHSQELVHRA